MHRLLARLAVAQLALAAAPRVRGAVNMRESAVIADGGHAHASVKIEIASNATDPSYFGLQTDKQHRHIAMAQMAFVLVVRCCL